MTAAERPPLRRLAKGDRLMMRGGTPGRRDGHRATEVRVVTIGRKFVHVIAADRFERYNPDTDRWYLRKFLIEDQHEGERGRRIGYSASIATPEQHEYDRLHGDADEYLREQGVVLRAASRWYGHEVLLARLMRDNEPPAAEADV
jgi:hypothetical protein